MKTLKQAKWMGALMGGLVALNGGSALASSHREAPAISNDPAADNTDVYAWTDRTNGVLNVIANYIPFEEPSGGPNFHAFSDDVLYEIHITQPGTLLTDGGADYNFDEQATFQFRFHTPAPAYVAPSADAAVGGGVEFFSQLAGTVAAQTVTVTRVANDGSSSTVFDGVSVAPANIGPRTDKVAYAISGADGTTPAYTDAYVAANFVHAQDGYTVFAGPRDDSFYVDLGGVFDLANLRAKGTAQDGLAGYNVHTIALQIPLSSLQGGASGHDGTAGDDSTIGIWASASRRKVRILRNDGSSAGYGPWVQVSRLGLPLVNEALVGIQDKDKYNRSTPATDLANIGGYILFPVAVRDAEAVGIYTALGVSSSTVTTLKGPRYDLVAAIDLDASGHHIPLTGVGDMLRVDLATDSSFPNGRPIAAGTNHEQADVTDVLLSLILAGAPSGISDGVDYNDKTFLASFPYLALPWRGYDQGHGKATP